MRRSFAFLAVLALAAIPQADAAVTSVVIHVVSQSSTSVTCSPAASYTAPVAAGTTICAVTVLPAGWSGSYTLSGADAALFTVSGGNMIVGASPLSVARDYTLTITVSP